MQPVDKIHGLRRNSVSLYIFAQWAKRYHGQWTSDGSENLDPFSLCLGQSTTVQHGPRHPHLDIVFLPPSPTSLQEKTHCCPNIRRRMPKAHRDATIQYSQPSYALTPGPSQRHHLSKSTPTPHRPLVYLADGEILTQDHPLPRLPGQVGFAGDRPQNGLILVSHQPMDTDNANTAYDHEPPSQPDMDEPVDPAKSRHRRKRVAQWKRWELEIIPMLIAPYMKLLESTLSLRNDPPPPRIKSCTCGDLGRHLAVTIVKFTGKSRSPFLILEILAHCCLALELVNIRACKCSPAAGQLLEMGYFPCAPYHPTLAIEVRMLQFVTKLFVRISPNNTAWCATVEDFLQNLGYKLTSAVC